MANAVCDDMGLGHCKLVLQYAKKCIKLCWAMQEHQPPLFLDFSRGRKLNSAFDTDHFRSYTKSGEYIGYVVLAPLFLYENGPLLAKGVAQGGDLVTVLYSPVA